MSKHLTCKRLVLGILGTLLAGVFLLGAMYYCRPGIPLPRPGSYDTNTQPLAPLAPGTIVAQSAPEGWSHLIIKTMPRVATGDVKRVGTGTKKLTALYFTALAANVEPRQDGDTVSYQLDRIGIGMGTRINGEDRVITPETWEQLGAKLEFLALTALDLTWEKVQAMCIRAKGETFGLVDVPVLLLQDGKHQPAVLRFALLVEARTGKLDTLLWGIACDEQGSYRRLLGELEWLAPAQQQDCLIHVDARELGPFGLPREEALALNQVHPGQQQLKPTPEITELAVLSRLTPEQAAALEQKLRQLFP